MSSASRMIFPKYKSALVTCILSPALDHRTFGLTHTPQTLWVSSIHSFLQPVFTEQISLLGPVLGAGDTSGSLFSQCLHLSSESPSPPLHLLLPSFTMVLITPTLTRISKLMSLARSLQLVAVYWNVTIFQNVLFSSLGGEAP